jgi:hypothetical protein
MAKSPKPTLSPDTEGKSADRRDRLAAALRENLKKRKDQARARARVRPADDIADKTTADTAKG